MITVATQHPDFATALSVQSTFPVSLVVAYLSEDKLVPKAFVIILRADVSNRDSLALINWDRVCEDLEEGFPMDCTRVRYIEHEEEAPTQDEEAGDTQNPPPPQGIWYHGEGGTPAKSKTQSPVLMVLPRRPPPHQQQDPQPIRQ